MKRRGQPYRVQVVADADLGYFREVVLGVRRRGFESGSMVFADRWLAHELDGDLGALIRRDRIDGVVAAIHSREMERRFSRIGVPVVNVSNAFAKSAIPLVTQDDHEVGRVAAGHLLACGCRRFAFWGQAGASYSEQRLAGFRRGLGARARVEVGVVGPEADRVVYAAMRDWLSRQEGELGVFAVLDTYALMLMRAARDLGRRVPEDVAVLGAGDEDFWVQFESVPLSSVRLPARAIGREAATLLEKWMRGAARKPGSVRLPGAAVAARRSTDVVHAEDEAVVKAVRFIRASADSNPYVGEVARAAGVSRTALGARFRASLGRTMLDEIRRAKIERAKELLQNVDLKIGEVAERCGFSSSQRFSVRFREEAGISPSRYRAKIRHG